MENSIRKFRKKVIPGSLANLVTKAAKFLLLIVIALISNEVNSQNISENNADYLPGGSVTGCPGSCVITLPPATIGKAYSFFIPGITGSTYTFQFDGFDPSGDCSAGSIALNSATGEITMAANDFCVFDPHPDEIEFNILVTNSTTSFQQSATCHLPIVRRPFKLVFVLDISGSMSTLVQGSATDTRWEVLKRSVGVFMDNLEKDSVYKDQVGLTYFTNYLVQPNAPMADKFLPNTGEKTLLPDRTSTFIDTDMGGRVPLARTSIGDGLVDAKTKLTRYSPVDTTRMIFLFTDGIQNEPPFIDPDGKSLAGGTIPINDVYPAGEGSIKICVVEVESFTPYAQILQNLATNNRGFYRSTTVGDETDLHEIFQDIFPLMLKDYSPQMVARKKGLIQNGMSSETFSINGGVGRVHLQLTFKNGDNLTMTVEKDGKDITQYAGINTKGYLQSMNFDLPLKTSPKTTAQGKWTVKISGQNGKRYSLACIADDHFLDYTCSLLKNDYNIGEPLKFSVNLKHSGLPLDSSANQVKAIILKPGEDLGHLLATSGWDFHQPDSDVVDAATQKYLDLLRNDSTFYEALLPSEQVVVLHHDSAGYYSGQFDKTDLTGIYNVIFMMKGEIPRLGSFERTETQATLFKFAETSDTKTDVKVSVDNGQKNTVTITVRPMNKFKKYLGPGLKNWVNVVLKSSSARMAGVGDNLDGSYSFAFTGLAAGENPIVSISVRGILVREKLLSKIESPQCTWNHWQILVLLLLILLLILYYLKIPGIQKLPKWLLWLFAIICLIVIILSKLGILNL